MCYIWHLHHLKCIIIIIIQWTCTTVIVPHSLINRNHGIDKQLISLIIQLDFLPWIYIIIITTDLSHEIASLSPPPGLHSIHTPLLSNFSNLSFVLHLHTYMHDSLNSCISIVTWETGKEIRCILVYCLCYSPSPSLSINVSICLRS